MPQQTVVGPGRERHLDHDFRFHPVNHAAGRHAGRRIREGTRFLRERLERPAKVPERLLGESRADAPAIDQLGRAAVVTHEQRPQRVARTARVCPAADHKFLALETFDLHPVRRPPFLVVTVDSLGDDALQTIMARLRKDLVARSGQVIVVADQARAFRLAEPALEQLLALDQRERRRSCPR